MAYLVSIVATPKATAPGVVHESTDWQIASDINFTNIIHESLNNQIDLLSYATILQTPGPYYGRSRFRYNVGITDWSDPQVCTPTP